MPSPAHARSVFGTALPGRGRRRPCPPSPTRVSWAPRRRGGAGPVPPPVAALVLGWGLWCAAASAEAEAQEGRGRGARRVDVGGQDAEADEDVDAETQVVDEGGTRVKVFRFSGLDLEGQLRSPSLLYFLSRLRAEFDRPRLPHRTFIPELVESAADREAFE